MKPERTIEHMREQFPMLFHNRSECLNHLFCVVGCGYCWNNGELVEDKDFGDNRKETDADTDDIPRVEFSTKNEHIEKMKKTLNYPDDVFPQEGFRVWNIHDGCWNYINICKVPPDASKEWREVCNEVVALLLEDGIDVANRTITAKGNTHTHGYWEGKRLKLKTSADRTVV